MAKVLKVLYSRARCTCDAVCGGGLTVPCIVLQIRACDEVVCGGGLTVPCMVLQVRDAALVAAGKCAAAFPGECRAALPELTRLWAAHLDDNIPSVRANAAAALGDALRAYEQELLDQILPLIRPVHMAQCLITRLGQKSLDRRCQDELCPYSWHCTAAAVLPVGEVSLAAAQSNEQQRSSSTVLSSTMQGLHAPARPVLQPLSVQVHRAWLPHQDGIPSAERKPAHACRTMLPKAREQKEMIASGSAASAPQPQAPTRAVPPPPGARVVSAEPWKPEQGGLFQDVSLTRVKGTGGIGEFTSTLGSSP